jgi:beta-lactamase class A
MLAVSDNAATNVLIDAVGMDAVNALGDRLGLRATVLRRLLGDEARRRGPDNTTCAADMADLMVALAIAPPGLPRPACRRVLAALAQSHHTDIVPRYLPPAARVVASKQGWLDTVLHDVALVEEPGRRVALAVLSSPPAAPEGLARVAAAAHRTVTSEPAASSF